jgi:hypothetical protein
VTVVNQHHVPSESPTRGTLEAKDVSAWFGARKVLDRVNLVMEQPSA